MTRKNRSTRKGPLFSSLMLLALFTASFFASDLPARATENAENPYVLVEENMEDPLFDRAWVNAETFLLDGTAARLHVMFQFSPEKAHSFQKEIPAEAAPLLFVAIFEVNRKELLFRRGDYQILDADGIMLSQNQGWTAWEAAEKDNPGALLLKVSDQLEEALRARGRWID